MVNICITGVSIDIGCCLYILFLSRERWDKRSRSLSWTLRWAWIITKISAQKYCGPKQGAI